MQAEAIQPGEQRNAWLFFQRRHAVQSQCLATRVRADGDAIAQARAEAMQGPKVRNGEAKPLRVDGCGLDLVKTGTDLEFQEGVDRISDQQATPLQHPDDA